jgi:hypothetical protein
VLRRIFGLNRDEVTGGWREFILRSSIICTLHQKTSLIKSMRMRWAGHVSCMGEMRNA